MAVVLSIVHPLKVVILGDMVLAVIVQAFYVLMAVREHIVGKMAMPLMRIALLIIFALPVCVRTAN